MAARPTWKGFIRFSLVSIPVRGYSAAAPASQGGKVTLHQLHKDCGSRVRYIKTCPTHGELKSDDIVSGYEFADDQYVVIDPAELSKIRSKNERTIEIEAFISDRKIDPRFHSGRTMYLTPEGNIGRKPYSMLHRLLIEEKKVGFATGVFSNRDQVMLLRPEENLIAATFLSYESEVRSPAEFEPEAPAVAVSPKELELAKTLVAQLTEDSFDFSKYRDRYHEELEKLVEAKVAGKEVVAAPAEEEPQVINLMEALQRSLDAAKAKAAPRRAGWPRPAQERRRRPPRPPAAASRRRRGDAATSTPSRPHDARRRHAPVRRADARDHGEGAVRWRSRLALRNQMGRLSRPVPHGCDG